MLTILQYVSIWEDRQAQDHMKAVMRRRAQQATEKYADSNEGNRATYRGLREPQAPHCR